MTSRVTSWDVARRAGVSRTTVSMVLNNFKAVSLSDKTRRRVQKAAADLGYIPNCAARMLVRGDTETIGLIISDASILPVDGFVPQLLHGISRINAQYGYHVLLEGLDPASSGNPYENLVMSRRIDGLIVLNPRSDDPNLEALIERGFPLVLVGSIRHLQECSVNFTTAEGIAAAVERLVGLGHRRIGTVPFSPAGFMATDERLALLRRQAAKHGITVPDSYIEYGNFSAESGHEAARRLLERHPEITAVMAGNDTIAVGVISAAAQLGRSVPLGLSVIGFDDLPFSAWLCPSLTTIHIDAVKQGEMAADLLIRLLRKEEIEQRQITLSARLVIRNSCATP